MIPQSFIQDLLNRLDIVEVVNRYVPLKKAGANYQACCPFHQEKSPSFTVSPSKQFYHCFGCGAHGSAISFVMEYQGLGFVEAVQQLAQHAGMQVPETREPQAAEKTSRLDALNAVLEKAAHYYRQQLKNAPAAVEYLKKRGLTGEIAKRFEIGYAPPDWQSLAAVFADYSAADLVQAGLVIEGEGKRYDRFRDRVMFPIRNQKGAVIGFGGRVLGQGEPKYLNSPETPVFSKGRELYGLPQAREGVRRSGRVLVVEGYMDVVALAQMGVDYAVATLGTATTTENAARLLRLSDRVVFCFDGDAAGRRAAWRALENCLPQLKDGKRVEFLLLPQGDDPDSYVRQHGAAAFEALLEEAAQPLSAFWLRELRERVDMASEEGRAELVTLAAPLLRAVAAPALAALMRRQLAQAVGLEGAALAEVLGEPVGMPVAAPASRFAPAPAGRGRKAPSMVRNLLRIVLAQPALASRLEPATLKAAGQPGQVELQALQLLIEVLANQPHISTMAAALEALRGHELEPVLQGVAADVLELGDSYSAAEDLDGAIRQLRGVAAGRKVDALRRKPLAELTADERRELQTLLLQKAGGDAVQE